jgi:hypothetical protein
MGTGRGMFESGFSAPLLVHHSYSGSLLHYDLLVQYIREGSVMTFRFRFTEVAEVRVKALLNGAALEEAQRMRLEAAWAVDPEAPWGVPLNEILSVTQAEGDSGNRVVIESTTHLLTIDYRDLEQELVPAGYSTYSVATYPGTVAE